MQTLSEWLADLADLLGGIAEDLPEKGMSFSAILCQNTATEARAWADRLKDAVVAPVQRSGPYNSLEPSPYLVEVKHGNAWGATHAEALANLQRALTGED